MGDYLDISEELRAQIEKHYARPEIIQAMLEASPNKEVVCSFGGTGYGKRPDILEYENDIQQLVKKGATSFHISEESWRNPLELAPGLDKKKLATMRTGWDLIIDIDSPHWATSKIITHNIVQSLKSFGVKNVSVKFSGNKGFHIGVPEESFANQYRGDFPDLPRKIGALLLERIMQQATNDVLIALKEEFGDGYQSKVAEIYEKPPERLWDGNKLNLIEVIEIDTILISPRHLYRMVYSVNEKSGLISIPINPDKVLLFEKHLADISKNVLSKYTFLDRSQSDPEETKRICVEAIDANFDVHKSIKKEYKETYQKKTQAEREYEEFKERIPEEFFPEAIKKMLAGNISDGKKRAVFVLKNFLNCVGWTYDEIQDRLEKWNQTHPEPLRETILKGQLMYLKNQIGQNEKTLPPNYQNHNYYSDIIGEMPEYKKARNPVTLAQRIFNSKK